MFGPWLLTWLIFDKIMPHYILPDFIALGSVIWSIFSIPTAWLYWSYAVPKWKLWAYSRVDDLERLKKEAIEIGLIWPDGSIFEKTEICSKTMRQQILQLEGRAG
jgi:hypothetical protein